MYYLTTHKPLHTDLLPKNLISDISTYLETCPHFSSEHKYNNVMKQLIGIVKNHDILPHANLLFAKEIKSVQKSAPLTEQTGWGGVVYKKVDVDKNYIQKLLVIKQYGVLGFEYHDYKIEQLTVLEGSCLLFYQHYSKNNTQKNGEIRAVLYTPGDTIKLQPKDKHGIIALQNLVIQETSTNHLDDLIYIYNSNQYFS